MDKATEKMVRELAERSNREAKDYNLNLRKYETELGEASRNYERVLDKLSLGKINPNHPDLKKYSDKKHQAEVNYHGLQLNFEKIEAEAKRKFGNNTEAMNLFNRLIR